MFDLDEGTVTKINQIASLPDFNKDGDERLKNILRCAPRVYWHNLPIPEKAYEIGEDLS